jgi:hypothetical protein
MVPFAARRALALALALLWPALAVGQTSPTEGWSTYQLAQYGVSLRHPADVVTVPPGGSLVLPPRFRVWLQSTAIANSPVAGAAPPLLALDVFDNPTGESLETWLGRPGAVPQARFGREPFEVGGLPAIRVTGSLQLAPSVFYYVARGAYIYRFTPLGLVGEQMLGTVSFLP